MKRRYLQKSIDELESIFKDARGNANTLRQLRQELELRKTKRAKALLDKVVRALNQPSENAYKMRLPGLPAEMPQPFDLQVVEEQQGDWQSWPPQSPSRAEPSPASVSPPNSIPPPQFQPRNADVGGEPTFAASTAAPPTPAQPVYATPVPANALSNREGTILLAVVGGMLVNALAVAALVLFLFPYLKTPSLHQEERSRPSIDAAPRFQGEMQLPIATPPQVVPSPAPIGPAPRNVIQTDPADTI